MYWPCHLTVSCYLCLMGLGTKHYNLHVRRSRTGRLTELDPMSLTPRRSHRSAANPARLLTCDMDMSPCTMSLAGGNWTVMKSPGE